MASTNSVTLAAELGLLALARHISDHRSGPGARELKIVVAVAHVSIHSREYHQVLGRPTQVHPVIAERWPLGTQKFESRHLGVRAAPQPVASPGTRHA
jgi:hypothetical protein